MKDDREKWNKRYLSSEWPQEASSIVTRFVSQTRMVGRALDIACGTGRDTRYLADKGFLVDAVDISEVGLRGLCALAGRVNPICADLDNFDIAPRTYDLIININFLQRRLFPQIAEGLKPGGMLIFQTYVEGPPTEGEPPHCREYLLRPNELLRAFLHLHICFYREKEESGVVASLVGICPGS